MEAHLFSAFSGNSLPERTVLTRLTVHPETTVTSVISRHTVHRVLKRMPGGFVATGTEATDITVFNQWLRPADRWHSGYAGCDRSRSAPRAGGSKRYGTPRRGKKTEIVLLTVMKTSPSAESGRRADRLLPRRGESPFCRPLLRGFSPQWTFPMGRPSPRHGAAVRGRTQNFFAGFMAKNFVDGISSPWTAETGCGYSSPRKVHSGKQAAGVAAEGLTAPSGAVALHTVRCAGSAVSGATGGGATGTVAASLVFQTSDRSGSPKPRQRVRRETGGCASSCLSESGLTTGCRPGSREPKVSPPPEIRTTETT